LNDIWLVFMKWVFMGRWQSVNNWYKSINYSPVTATLSSHRSHTDAAAAAAEAASTFSCCSADLLV